MIQEDIEVARAREPGLGVERRLVPRVVPPSALLSHEHRLHLLDWHIGYLTGGKVVTPFLDRFKVVGTETLDPRKMKALLRKHEVGRLLVRKRGIAERPHTLEKRFLTRSYGDQTLTLLAARIGDRHIGILGEQETEK